MKKLKRSFYRRPLLEVAPELLGKILVRRSGATLTSGRIVEVEAYGGQDDPASHAFRGLSERNEVMFGEAGYAYVYFIYGMYYCVNAVCDRPGRAGACLIRALEPLEGTGLMMRRRRTHDRRNLTNGPGKLCAAMNIDRRLNGCDLLGDTLFIADDGGAGFSVERSKRIGIRQAQNRLWRFYIADNPYVSAHRRRPA